MSNQARSKTGFIIPDDVLLLGEWLVASPLTAAEIGARLAKLRREKGITQGELADLLGTSQPMVSDYERGELRLHGELIVELTRILGCSADDLLGLTNGKRSSSAPQNRRLSRRLQAIDQLSKRDQEALFRTIDAFISKS